MRSDPLGNNTPAFTLWRKMNISLVALIAGIAIAHLALLAWLGFLMATTDFSPPATMFIALASPAAGYTVPIAIAARSIFKQFDSLLTVEMTSSETPPTTLPSLSPTTAE